MASSEEQPQSLQTLDDDLPLVLIHCLPQFDLSFLRFPTRFHLLDPSDPSWHARAPSARVVLCIGPSPVTTQTLDGFPSLECLVGSSAGLDHVDLAECRRRGVRVTNAGDAFSEDVADCAVALLVDVLRRISAADRFVRAGLWPVKRDYPLGSKIGRRRVGIVGLGSIGSMIAKRLGAFGCNIAYNSRKKKPNVSFPYYSSVQELATNSDVLVVSCALTSETRHIINKDVLTALGKEGVIINIGRWGSR